jgi:hypothetical protein
MWKRDELSGLDIVGRGAVLLEENAMNHVPAKR